LVVFENLDHKHTAEHDQQQLDFGMVMTENSQVSSKRLVRFSIFPVSTSFQVNIAFICQHSPA